MSTKSKTITIIVIALGLAIVVFASNNENFVSAHKILTVQERYDSGYNHGAKYCGSGADIIDTYRHSSKYLHHTHLYQQGFDKAALTDCSKTLSTPNNTLQQPTPNNTSPTTGPTNNQGPTNKTDQLNNQRLLCIIINGPGYGACGNTNGQSQGINQQSPR
jgi:hypothetical protein